MKRTKIIFILNVMREEYLEVHKDLENLEVTNKEVEESVELVIGVIRRDSEGFDADEEVDIDGTCRLNHTSCDHG